MGKRRPPTAEYADSVVAPGDPLLESIRVKSMKQRSLQRPFFLQPLHIGSDQMRRMNESYLPLISSHLFGLTETQQLSETHDAFSGRAEVTIKGLKLGLPDDEIGYRRKKGKGYSNSLSSSVSELLEERIQELKENHLRSRTIKERKWVEQLQPQKWRCLHDLHAAVVESSKRSQPNPLDRAFINGTSDCLIPKPAFMSLFLTNFAFNEKEMVLCSEALGCIFGILDRNFDDLVDYRDFLCHFYAMGTLRLEAKLSKCFQFFVGLDAKISLHQLWQIIRVTGEDDQLEVFARELTRGMKKLAMREKYVCIREDLQVIIERCITAGDWDRLVRDATRDLTSNVQRKNPFLNQLHAVTKVVEPHFVENKRDGFVDVRINKATFHELLKACEGLIPLLRKLYWDRNPIHVKGSVFYANMETAASRFNKTNQKINIIRAKTWWQQQVLPRRLEMWFSLWRDFTRKQRRMKAAEKFWRDRRTTLALKRLGLWAEEAMFESQRNQLAETFSSRRMKRHVFAHFQKVVGLERQDFDFQLLVATTHYTKTLLIRQFNAWKEVYERTKRVREMLSRWRHREKYTFFHTWRSNVKTIKEQRQMNNRLGSLRQSMLDSDLKESERQAEQERRRLAQEREQLRILEEQREEERKKEEEMWKQRRRDAQDNVYKVKILRQQEEEREARKKEKKEKEAAEEKRIWEELLKKNEREAKLEAEAFVRTEEGAAMLNKNAIEIQHDPSVVASGGRQGEDWQKLFDPTLEIYFLYNTETGEKVYTEGLTKEEALEVAKTNYISRQIQLASEATQELRERERQRKVKEDAVKTIASLLRARKCRRIVQELISLNYMKRMDPYNGKLYYYNLKSRKKVGQKPLNLGKKDIKPLEWNLRIDSQGNALYENSVSPWLSSSVKPSGFLQCSVCEIYLATHACSTCEEHTCVDCFENKHAISTEHIYERAMQLQKKVCVCCKEKEASRHCVSCGMEDFYCSRCFRLTHPRQNKKKASHHVVEF